MGMNWQTAQFSFSAGLGQNQGVRVGNPPYLDVAKDVQFDSLGELIARYPFAAIGSNILGGGTISNARRIVENGTELLLFTDTSLYSWSARDTAWVLKAAHLAVAVTEKTVFGASEDQVSADRAELGSTVFYTWVGSTAVASLVRVAAMDKATGAVTLATTTAAVNAAQPRLVALTTKVLLFFTGVGGLQVFALDPATANISLGAATNVTLGVSAPYDVVRIPGADTAYVAVTLAPTTSYGIAKVTAALGVTTATKARVCDGPIAVSVDPTGTFAQIVRGNGVNIQGDLLNVSTNADVFTAQAVGAGVGTINHIAVAHRSVTNGGFYRAYTFWSSSEAAGAGVNWQSKLNWVDTNNGLGAQATFIRLLAIASRAFDYAGSVYVWGTFAGATPAGPIGFVQQLQNTMFLYRDDATLVTKAAFDIGGGLLFDTQLPGVVNTSGNTFALCTAVRRRIPIGGSSTSLGYAERAPRDIVFTFDSNDARRCARLGPTLYVAGGGEVLQYDGSGLYEVGFHIYPWSIGATQAAAGTLANGNYAYKATWKWPNARGDIDRSTTATVALGTIAASPIGFDVTVNPLFTTRKTAQPPACEIWRTTVTPTADSPFYLVTSPDPSVTAGSNKYLPNSTSTFPLATLHDALNDSSIAILETNPENGAVLEALAPPGATIVLASDTRLFIAGVPGDPDRVRYSKQRGPDEVAAFNDALVIEVPATGGDITGLAFLNETLIVFRQYAIFAFPGDGFDNAGGGNNYGPARLLSNDLGAVNHDSIALYDQGLIFKSKKGWMVLNRGWSIDDIGGSVRNYDSETPLAAHVMPAQRQIRCLSSARMLVFDYAVKQWDEWTISDGLHAAIWQGTYAYLAASGPKSEQATYTSLTYGIDVETKWIKLADLQGAARVRWFEALGEYRSACIVRCRVARDYEYDGSGNPAWFDDVAWTVSPTTVGSAFQLRHAPSRPQGEAFKIRLTAVAEGLRALLTISTSTDHISCVAAANWSAVLAASDPFLGTIGNTLTFSCAFDSISTGTFSIDVRDHLVWNQTSQRWIEQQNNVGIRVRCRTGSAPTVANMESAINSGSSISFVAIADATPSKVISAALMNGTAATGGFAGGTFGSPTGEAIKLTGLALQYGVRPGINRRVPLAQKR